MFRALHVTLGTCHWTVLTVVSSNLHPPREDPEAWPGVVPKAGLYTEPGPKSLLFLKMSGPGVQMAQRLLVCCPVRIGVEETGGLCSQGKGSEGGRLSWGGAGQPGPTGFGG